MDQTTALLLRLVRSVLTDTPVALPENLDEESLGQLYRLARQQDLAHLACEGLRRAKALPGGELGAQFRKQRMAAIYGDERKQQVLQQISQCLAGLQIPFMPLKGSILREYYPEPWMRTRCDIDVLVHPEDLDRACEALEALGYKKEGKYAHDISLFSPEKVHLELHFILHRNDENIPLPLLETVWEHARPAEPGSFHYVMDDAMFYFYHVGHIAKHIRGDGCGLRPFVDTWLLDHREDADKAGREELLEQDGLLTFAQTASRLAESWLTDAPCEDLVCQQLEEFVISSGIYGNETNRVVNSRHQPVSLLRQVFPPYASMAMAYQILYEKPWLYPFYHVVRWKDGLLRVGIRGKLEKMKHHRQAYEEQHTGVRQLMEALDLWKLEE